MSFGPIELIVVIAMVAGVFLIVRWRFGDDDVQQMAAAGAAAGWQDDPMESTDSPSDGDSSRRRKSRLDDALHGATTPPS